MIKLPAQQQRMAAGGHTTALPARRNQEAAIEQVVELHGQPGLTMQLMH
jgi:hypothetical protein